MEAVGGRKRKREARRQSKRRMKRELLPVSGLAATVALRIGCASCERWNALSKFVDITRSKSSAVYAIVGLRMFVPASGGGSKNDGWMDK